ncbi:transporter [Albimonas sp. CAU 1670]|uniref:SphA family protein n=1 Tax=Albimonas sp. CAU 1670 TaxID=3032599 RepID=UPI0023D98C30|nr:transporter [Albimonas sp. CAU 1670]MDF2232714.1 transporter [Albimonas sp. CAU 1670]
MSRPAQSRIASRVPSRRSAAVAAVLAAWALLAAAPEARAAEGASSHYLPGATGDLLLAAPSQPGLTVANTVWVQSGDVGRAVLGGRARAGLELDLVLDLAAASYTFETPVLGAAYSVAALIPFGRADLTAFAVGPAGRRFDRSGDRFDLSDAAFVPIQLNWTHGPFFFEASETIIAPTGGYERGRAINLGRNYWSFDTNVAATWFDPEGGREISIAPGLMVNTENPSTDYRTGTEFHMDVTATQFLSQSFAVGLRGYWYQQIEGDSGAGARLGDFRSSSVGLGLGFMWTPAAAEGRLTVLGKWMHDLDADNRFRSDYLSATLAWKF